MLNTYPVNENVTLLRADGGQVQLATNDYGKGRGVYISGLPYSAANARLLERVLFYASHNEERVCGLELVRSGMRSGHTSPSKGCIA